MKRKTIYAGTLALALSIGVVTPIENNAIGSVAYATGSQTSLTDTPTNGNGSTDNTDTTNNGGAQATENKKLNDLRKLTAEEEDVKKSTRYINASSAEKNAYTSAIAAGKGVKADANDKAINGLIAAINAAKENLGASSFDTYEQREGLSSTIAIAEKLSASIAGNANVKKEDKDKLKDAITVAKADEKDVNKSKDEITTSNNNLAQTINDIIKSNNLDANNSALTYDEIEKVTPSDNASYGKAYIRLDELINSVKEFTKTNSYKKLNPDTHTNLTNASTQAAEVYNNLNSDTSKLNDAYSNLSKAYNSALEKSNTADTEVSRLRKQIEDSTSKNPEGYDKAGESARLTYDIAKAKANELIAKDNTNAADLQKALNNLNLAKLALAPVQTKKLDDNQSQKSPLETLKELVNGAANYRNQDPYKSASIDDKKVYDEAIKEAKSIIDKTNPSNGEIDSAIEVIKDAQANLKTSKVDTPANQVDQAKALLKNLVDNKDKVHDSEVYTKADNKLKTAYDTALANANQILKDINEGKEVGLEKINESISGVVEALTDLGYTDVVKYPTTLKELVNEAPTFKKTYAYYVKNTSTNSDDKALIKTYDDLIADANTYLSQDKQDPAVLARYVERINDVKKAIQSQISLTELTLRGYVASAATFEDSKEFKAAAASTNPVVKKSTEDYKNLITEAKAHLASTDKTETSMGEYVRKIENAIGLINKPTEENANKYQLFKLIEDADKVVKHPKYNEVAQQYRDNLEKALKKAKGAETNKEVLAAISDLEAALRNKDFQKLLADTIKLESIEEIEKLLELADKVQAHPDYKEVTSAQKNNLNEAIAAANNALKSGKASDIEDARTFLTNQLNQSEIKRIVEKINKATENDEPADLKELRQLLDLANKVKEHKDYKKVEKSLKDELETAIDKAKLAITSKDETKIKEAKIDLENTLAKFKDIVEDLKNNTLTPRETIEKIISQDQTLRNSVKYKKAQKSLREAYDKAFEVAKTLINKDTASDDELKTASTNLVNALDALDGNEFTDRVTKLKEKFQKEGSNITDANKKAAVEAKIKALDDENATMDDLLAAEAELANALKLNGTTTPVKTTTTTTPVSGTTTTTTPVTTTREVPATINPGSIVRTGIKSLVGVGVVLVVALGAYALTGKNKNKEDNVKTKRRNNNEIK